ncbi:uncharacterized protein BP5553_07393 [Venustampulla echinocandica]|uniref:Cytochrome P450 n=1 Tax=Venustampulla echinocandica TaxID=2656787 RepID=A0A370TJE8_9HELO|nr:uncharacterized protein BP5553_07393 [Venustampulla echinocandica]RDL35462.1 hypothetical protein BP5553_07393 [Venustampulla echinocandica]
MTVIDPLKQAALAMSYLQLLATAALVFCSSVAFYRLYIHPLSKHPGPRLWALTRIPMAYNGYTGYLPYRIAELHDKYGPIVRLAPDEVSFITASAWGDIYMKQPGKPQLGKNPYDFLPPASGVVGLGPWPIPDDVHNRIRRNFSSAFSEKSVREQEPILQKYISQLVSKLHENCAQPVNILQWYNFTTFDVIGDLTFGESFACLETSTLHAWVLDVFEFVAAAFMLGLTQYFWPLTPILMAMVPRNFREAASRHTTMTKEKLDRRLGYTESRPDFVEPALKLLDTPNGVSYQELLETVVALMVGGSESTASVLSGLTYHLLRNPPVMAKLTDAIRTSYKSPDEINLTNVSNVTYLVAVLNEALRLFPPVPGALRRITPPEGCTISGHFIPGDTKVAVDLYAAGHSALNFTRPKEFIPERWLADPPLEFKGDNRKVCQSFSAGPRNCLGQNLAHAEMRLIMTNLLWEFDFELAEESKSWLKGLKVITFIEKRPLMVKLTPVVRT